MKSEEYRNQIFRVSISGYVLKNQDHKSKVKISVSPSDLDSKMAITLSIL